MIFIQLYVKKEGKRKLIIERGKHHRLSPQIQQNKQTATRVDQQQQEQHQQQSTGREHIHEQTNMNNNNNNKRNTSLNKNGKAIIKTK